MQSMEEVYQQHAQTVFKYLRTLTHNEDLAEELTQETFYQAIRSINRFDGSCKVSTWLCAIAKRVWLTYLRKHPTMEDVEDVQMETASSEALAIDQISRMELIKKVHALEEPYREIVMLRALGGLSFREIGEVLGKTENYARVYYYRGKEKLRKEVNRDEM